MFLQECKYIEKEAIRHTNDALGNFSETDESDKNYFFNTCTITLQNFFNKHSVFFLAVLDREKESPHWINLSILDKSLLTG